MGAHLQKDSCIDTLTLFGQYPRSANNLDTFLGVTFKHIELDCSTQNFPQKMTQEDKH